MIKERTPAIALRSTGLAMALLVGDDLITGRVARKAAHGGYTDIKATLGTWLDRYEPDFVVMEDHQTFPRNGARQRRSLRYLPSFARRFPCIVQLLERVQPYQNKYAEATELAKRFSCLRDRVPAKPPIWESEAYFILLFEAVALGVSFIDEIVSQRSDRTAAQPTPVVGAAHPAAMAKAAW